MYKCSIDTCVAVVKKRGERCPPHQFRPELRPTVPAYSPHYNKPAGWPWAPGKEPQPEIGPYLTPRQVFAKLQEQINERS